MPISLRYFIVPETGPLLHVPQRVVEGIHNGSDALPDLAGSRQRSVEVVLDNEGGKPVRILDVRGRYWQFEEDGHLKRDDEWMRFAFGPEPKTTGRVVDIRPQLERAQWMARTRWEVTHDVLDRIAAAVWPSNEAATAEVRTVTGRAPKRPPLTHEGRDALEKVSRKVTEIGFELDGLSEAALKGVVYEARQYAGVYAGEEALWGGVAAFAERQREIRAQRRTGKGVWYAVVRVWLDSSSGRESREVKTLEERCEGKGAAIEVAQRLLAENAHHLREDVRVEAEVLTELEWTPLDRT